MQFLRRKRKSLLAVFLLALVSFQAHGWTVSSIKIAPPRSSREWEQLASLLVEIFDDYSVWEWNQRRITEKFVLQRYVDTAKRMQGKKYALLVARAGSVVGMVEMGLSQSTNNTRTTIGVLAVSTKLQRQGIGALLLEQCETIAATWNKTMVYVEVEPDNDSALRFFERHGYSILQEGSTVMVRRRRILEERPHLLLCKQLNS